MAQLHEATISPRKDELIQPWLRGRTWWDGVEARDPVGTFRLDDPAGEVGIECFIFGSAEGSTLFVPVTYRAAALEDGDAGLIGTLEHSVLGRRWVYDACVDPVFLATVLATIRDGGHEAALSLHRADGTVVQREPTARVRGAGAPATPSVDPTEEVRTREADGYTQVRAATAQVNVVRRVGVELPAGPALVGEYAGGTGLVLVTVG
jgi:hypothetical protein